MNLRILLLVAIIYFAPKGWAEETAGISPNQENREPAAEEVTSRQSLAVHMGLTSKDAIFGKPRNFRSEALNNFQLDPLTEAEDP